MTRKPKLTFKSSPLFFYKERDGEKPNTVRAVDDMDERYETLCYKHPKRIRIEQSINGEYFIRTITDVSWWPQKKLWIISWKHEEGEK